MDDINDVNKAMQGMFILGVVYENKLQKKYGSDKLTEEDIAAMEQYIDDISESLPPHLKEILQTRKVNLFMGLTTDIYM